MQKLTFIYLFVLIYFMIKRVNKTTAPFSPRFLYKWNARRFFKAKYIKRSILCISTNRRTFFGQVYFERPHFCDMKLTFMFLRPRSVFVRFSLLSTMSSFCWRALHLYTKTFKDDKPATPPFCSILSASCDGPYFQFEINHDCRRSLKSFMEFQ